MSNNLYRALVILSAVCIVLVVGFHLKSYLFISEDPRADAFVPDAERVTAIAQASAIGVKTRSGELELAIAEYDTVMASTTLPLSNKASSVLLGASLRFRQSGNPVDAVAAIKDLKQIVSAPDVSEYVRGYAMLEMTLILTASSRDEAVFDEIFRDEPWSSFLVREDGITNHYASTQQLLARSLQLYSNYRTAIALAANYSRELYTRGESFAGIQNNLDSIEIHLAQAEDLARLQSDEQPDGSDRYENYLSNRAFVIATLADFKGSPYRERYRQTYEDLFTFLRGQEDVYADARGRLAYEHVMFARALLRIDDDSVRARDHLNQAVQITNTDPLKEQNALTQWVRSAQKSDERQLITGFNELVSVSPEFKQFVDTIQ